jgi:sphingomyelin phosphodiesterase
MYPSTNVYLGAEDECSIQWLYDTALDAWSENLDAEAQARMKDGGFYAQRVKGVENLIAVSLNMNFGDSENWWLLADSIDPYGQMQWFSNTLQKAEDNGDKVILIGHQPSSSEISSFKDVYFDLLLRYESTVVGQFFGHTHVDEWKVNLDPYNISRGFGIIFQAGSITTYSDLNVGYRVYEFDYKTHQLVDFHNHVFNMTEANLHGTAPPTWYLEYTAKGAYGFNSTTGISPQDWADLTLEFETNNQLWNDYYFYKAKSARPYGTCTGSCQTSEICSMRTTRNGVDFCSDMAVPPTDLEKRQWLRNQRKHC